MAPVVIDRVTTVTIQTLPTVDQVLSSAAAHASNEQAQAVASEHFGLQARAVQLAGERDLNFHLQCADGSQYLLKLSNPAEDAHVTDFQNKALLHILHTDPQLPVQRVYPNLRGHYQTPIVLNAEKVLARLFSFVEGTPLNQVAVPSRKLRTELGAQLAHLGLALRGFFHPAAGHELLWDIKHSSRLTDLIECIPNNADRQLAKHFLDNFKTYALPQLKGLRAQVIHNDLNLHNVIVDAEQPDVIRNILDFGDMVHAPLINDVAVAASYQLGREGNPLDQACEFIAAYHRVCPLETLEQHILFDLITARLVMTVAITNWRASVYPDNSAYILRNAPLAWSSLRAFANLTRESAQQQIRHACSQEAAL
ncbi:putative homoserine kinase type II (protein kinase fold) [Pseudomonas sp. GM60]|nr:putative homoserine kinase type II (protein kinase fold) [Pseudomonas sp. GM60]